MTASETDSHPALRHRWHRVVPLVMRVVGAVAGGYALAALTSVAVLALPIPASQAIVAGMLMSFLVYAGAVIWVFIARSAVRAWAGLAIVGVPLALAAWAVMAGPLGKTL